MQFTCTVQFTFYGGALFSTGAVHLGRGSKLQSNVTLKTPPRMPERFLHIRHCRSSFDKLDEAHIPLAFDGLVGLDARSRCISDGYYKERRFEAFLAGIMPYYAIMQPRY
ncbi:hypothetical protein EV421DRAFT_1746618 [Armillaria borealis]|uniref:Uncharacterized protein n=1 Tax=Armillaria borealis TaxID=47425 RepID=A0AA39M5G8_9AGAR|nr:hypothetical protein EV421DRAFT_1746618 [Armillaria borealis]